MHKLSKQNLAETERNVYKENQNNKKRDKLDIFSNKKTLMFLTYAYFIFQDIRIKAACREKVVKIIAYFI